MSLGNLGTFAGRQGADKEQCRQAHTFREDGRRERHRNCREILWQGAMINLAAQRAAFVAAISNRVTLAVFQRGAHVSARLLQGAEIGRRAVSWEFFCFQFCGESL